MDDTNSDWCVKGIAGSWMPSTLAISAISYYYYCYLCELSVVHPAGLGAYIAILLYSFLKNMWWYQNPMPSCDPLSGLKLKQSKFSWNVKGRLISSHINHFSHFHNILGLLLWGYIFTFLQQKQTKAQAQIILHCTPRVISSCAVGRAASVIALCPFHVVRALAGNLGAVHCTT